MSGNCTPVTSKSCTKVVVGAAALRGFELWLEPGRDWLQASWETHRQREQPIHTFNMSVSVTMKCTQELPIPLHDYKETWSAWLVHRTFTGLPQEPLSSVHGDLTFTHINCSYSLFKGTAHSLSDEGAKLAFMEVFGQRIYKKRNFFRKSGKMSIHLK